MRFSVQQRFNGAGDGNRTRTSSLEGYSSTIELLPPGRNFLLRRRRTDWFSPTPSNDSHKPKSVEGGGLLRASGNCSCIALPPASMPSLALRPPPGQPSAVQNRSRRFCRTSGSHPPQSIFSHNQTLVEGGGFEPPKA